MKLDIFSSLSLFLIICLCRFFFYWDIRLFLLLIYNHLYVKNILTCLYKFFFSLFFTFQFCFTLFNIKIYKYLGNQASKSFSLQFLVLVSYVRWQVLSRSHGILWQLRVLSGVDFPALNPPSWWLSNFFFLLWLEVKSTFCLANHYPQKYLFKKKLKILHETLLTLTTYYIVWYFLFD